MEAAQVPSIDKWIKQLWDINTMEFYSDIKKKKCLPFATVGMYQENIMLSEINKPVRKRQIPYDFHSYVESNEQAELTSKSETD